MCKSTRGFSLAFMRKSKLKKKKKQRKLLNMMVPNFYFLITYGVCTEYCLYTNSTLLLGTKTTRTQSFTFYKEFFFGLFYSK